MWRLVLKIAIAIGLDKWAKRKAIQVAAKLRSRAVRKADSVMQAVGGVVAGPGSIIVREDKDTLRPGAVVIRDSRSYRVTKLLMTNKLGVFYEAVAE